MSGKQIDYIMVKNKSIPGHTYKYGLTLFPLSCRCVTDNIVVISKALTSQFVIPEFKTFTDIIDTIYESCKENDKGIVRPFSAHRYKYMLYLCIKIYIWLWVLESFVFKLLLTHGRVTQSDVFVDDELFLLYSSGHFIHN